MGLLNIFSKADPTVQRLPHGSMTVDRHGNVVITTVSSAHAPELLRSIADEILLLFREAQATQLALSEFEIHFASLQITAHELRGGALIFLSPKTQFTSLPAN